MGRIALLQLSVGTDERQGLSLGLDDWIDFAAENDEDVEVRQAVVCLLPRDLRTNNNALLALNFGLACGNGDLEGLRSCLQRGCVSFYPTAADR